MALLEDDLYFEMSRHANKMALLIKEACIKKGYRFLVPSTTNQQFPIMPDEVLEKLKDKYEYAFWQKVDDHHSAVRFCTSWATNVADVAQLIADIEKA